MWKDRTTADEKNGEGDIFLIFDIYDRCTTVFCVISTWTMFIWRVFLFQGVHNKHKSSSCHALPSFPRNLDSPSCSSMQLHRRTPPFSSFVVLECKYGKGVAPWAGFLPWVSSFAIQSCQSFQEAVNFGVCVYVVLHYQSSHCSNRVSLSVTKFYTT